MSGPSFFRGPTRPDAEGATSAGEAPVGPVGAGAVEAPYAAPGDRRTASHHGADVPPVPVSGGGWTGERQTGARHTGDRQTGDRQTGDRQTGGAPVVFSEVVLRAAAATRPADPVATSVATGRRTLTAGAATADEAAEILAAVADRLRRGERLLGEPHEPAVLAAVLAAMLTGRSRFP